MEDRTGDDDSDLRVASGGTSVNLEPEIETADALEEALRGLNNLESTGEKRYIEIPKVNLDHIIIPNDQVKVIKTDFIYSDKVSL